MAEHPVRVRLRRVQGETPGGLLRRDLYYPALIGNTGWSEDADHTDYTTIAAGEFSQPGMGPKSARKLRVLDDQDTLTMTWTPEWLHDQDREPERIRELLEAILRSRRPVELMMKRKALPGATALLKADMTLRRLQAQYKAGEPDTLYYTLTWKEWRHASAERKGAGRPADVPRTHRLTRDDTLYSLAMHYYHSATKADDIAKANGIRGWGKKTPLVEHSRFKEGSKIKLPAIKRDTNFDSVD